MFTGPISRFALVMFALLSFPNAFAKKAPPTMKEFNKKCPAPELCKEMSRSMDGCQSGKKDACSEFVNSYRKLLPEYDCQRSFDSTPTENYTVPAIWLCEDTHEKFLDFLSKMKAPNSVKLFGSQELRDTLDGHLAEEYAP